jgi:hypothetical protein
MGSLPASGSIPALPAEVSPRFIQFTDGQGNYRQAVACTPLIYNQCPNPLLIGAKPWYPQSTSGEVFNKYVSPFITAPSLIQGPPGADGGPLGYFWTNTPDNTSFDTAGETLAHLSGLPSGTFDIQAWGAFKNTGTGTDYLNISVYDAHGLFQAQGLIFATGTGDSPRINWNGAMASGTLINTVDGNEVYAECQSGANAWVLENPATGATTNCMHLRAIQVA